MKLLSLFFILSIIVNFSAFSQIEERDGRILSPTFPGGIVEVSGLPPASTEGTTYIYDSWNLGSVALKSQQSLKNIPIRYDLYNNYLEISSDKGIKVIYSEKIKYFEWLNSLGKTEIYYNVDAFKSDEEISGSFFEIIINGKLILTALKEVEYVSPHYNQALDAGHEEARYISKENFYYIDEERTATKIPRKKKEFYKIFGDSNVEMESYIKSKKFSIKERYALKKIFEHYNSLNSEL